MPFLRRFAVVLLALVAVYGLPVSPAHATSTYSGAWIDGEAGADIVDNLTLSSNAVDFMAGGNANVQFHSQMGSKHYSFYFGAPTGDLQTTGTYDNATANCALDHGCLQIRETNDNCTALSGRFIIDEATFSGGVPQTFAVRFEQHCNDQDEALFGALYYNASVAHRSRSLSDNTWDLRLFDTNPVSKTITITNDGVGDLHPSQFALTQDDGFTITGNTCPSVLTSGTSCTVQLTFTPTGSGYFPATLSFTDELAPLGPGGAAATVGTGREIHLFAYVTIDVGATRVAGADRVMTSISASNDAFDDHTAETVVLSRMDAFADALAGAPLAVKVGGPLLLNPSSHLDYRVASEIQRVLPAGKTVVILGGSQALDPSVETSVHQLGYLTKRLSGANRFETAVNIANEITGGAEPSNIFLATGLNFPDALSAGAAAAPADAVVVLTNGDQDIAPTTNYLGAHPDATPWCFGGPACQAYPWTVQIIGQDRFQTAEMTAQIFFFQPFVVGVASGRGFADALSGATHLRGMGPLLLTESTSLPGPSAEYLDDNRLAIVAGAIYGGTAVVGDGVLTNVDTRIKAS